MGSEFHGVVYVVVLNVVANVGLATKDVESSLYGLDLKVAFALSRVVIRIKIGPFSLEINTRQL